MKILIFVKVFLMVSVFALTACDTSQSFVANIPDASGNGGTSGGTGGTGGANEPAMVFGPGQVNGIGKVLLAGDSSKIVFTDDSDPLGTNPGDDWQVWSLDLASGDVTQLTFADFSGFSPSNIIDISDNGGQVVFSSRYDLTGDNPNNLSNVFIAATDGSGIIQVTSFNDGGEYGGDPAISGDASVIAFLSDRDLTGDNPALDAQIFTIEPGGANLTQISSGNLVPQNIAFSDNGSTIAFQGLGDPFGTNADNGWEIFTINVDGTNLTQLTASDGDSLSPQLSDDGSLLVFASDGDHSPGGNADGGYEIFVAPTDGGAITQVSSGTVDTGGVPRTAGYYSISGNGAYVVFESDADFTGDNFDTEFTIFWADTNGGAVSQLLRSGTVPDTVDRRIADKPTLGNDGSIVAFLSFVNYTSTTQPSNDKIYTIARQ